MTSTVASAGPLFISIKAPAQVGFISSSVSSSAGIRSPRNKEENPRQEALTLSEKEFDVRHRVVFLIERPQLYREYKGTGGLQGVSKLETVRLLVLI